MSSPTYSDESPGTTRRISHQDSEVDAFIPDPLPPDVPLESTLWNALSEADRALGELAGLGRNLDNPQLFIRPFLRTEAVMSSRIEGTRADLTDLYAFEAEQLSFDRGDEDSRAQTDRGDAKEVHNYVSALEYGLTRLDDLPLVVRLLRELHEKLLTGVRGEHQRPGELRTTQNWIAPIGGDISSARYVPPPAGEVADLMAQLEEYINTAEGYPPLIRIGLIHYQFETIHPFRDGNGRVGRLLVTLLMVHWDLLPLPLLYLSAYFERHRQEYMDRLLAVSTQNEWAEWLLFFLEGVRAQAVEANKTAKKLSDLKNSWREEIQSQPRSSALQLALIDALFERPVLSIPQAADILDVSYQSAKNNVERLRDAEANILTEIPDTYPQLFASMPILTELERSIQDTDSVTSSVVETES